MSAISIPRAAFAGFGLMAKRPVSVLVWMVIGFGYLFGIGMMGASMAGEAMAAMADMQSSGEFDMTSYMEVSRQAGPYSGLTILFRFTIGVLLTSAVLRAAVRPADGGLAFIKIGGQELKLAVTVLVVGVISSLAAGAVFVLLLIAAAILAGTGGRGAAAAVGIGGVVAMIAAAFFFYIKFCLASPQTVREKAIRIFESWTLTKGRFWPILGATLLSILAMLPVAAITLGGAVAIGVYGEGLGWREVINFVTQPAYTVEEMRSPARIATCALMAILWIFTTVISLGMAANLYEQITGNAPVETAGADEGDDDDDDDDED